MVEVFRFSFPAHPVGNRSQNSLHHSEVLPVVVRLQNSRRLGRTEGRDDDNYHDDDYDDDHGADDDDVDDDDDLSRSRKGPRPPTAGRAANWLTGWI